MKKKNINATLEAVAKFFPHDQLMQLRKHKNIFRDEINRLAALIPTIPKISNSKFSQEPKIYLHYFSPFGNYYIYEFDGDDTMFGKAQLYAFPDEPQYRKFSLMNLKSNTFIELEM
ncbi:hypothetical protein R84B8_00643 [Treponema sp. R8-4-B8]